MQIRVAAPSATLHMLAIATDEVGVASQISDGQIRFAWDPTTDKALELALTNAIVVRLETTAKGEPRISMPALLGIFAQTRLGLGQAEMISGRAYWTLHRGKKHAAQVMPGVLVELMT